MKIIANADINGDPRKRPPRNTARIELQVYLNIPDGDLNKIDLPGKSTQAIDVAHEKIKDATSVGDLLRRIERWSDGAVVRASGR